MLAAQPLLETGPNKEEEEKEDSPSALLATALSRRYSFYTTTTTTSYFSSSFLVIFYGMDWSREEERRREERREEWSGVGEGAGDDIDLTDCCLLFAVHFPVEPKKGRQTEKEREERQHETMRDTK